MNVLKYSLTISYLIMLLAFLDLNAQFSEISESAGVNIFCDTPTFMGGGVAVFDYNNDGWEDFYISGGLNKDQLFVNNGDGTFEDLSEEIGLSVTGNTITAGVCTGDIDNDGIREIFVYSTMPAEFNVMTPAVNYLFKQNEQGILENIAPSIGIADTAFTMGASFGDYNLDGYLDLFVANYIIEPRSETDSSGNEIFTHLCWDNHFYVNNGDGTFTESAIDLGLSNSGCALAVAFTDLNNDHISDLYLANDFGEYILPNAAYLNEYPNEGFSDISLSSGLDAQMFGMGIAVGDYDNDLDLDYYITNLGRNILYRNDGNNIFTDVATEAGVENTYAEDLLATGWGCNFADFDQDGNLDLFVANGYVPTADFIQANEVDPNFLYMNNGSGNFTNFANEFGVGNTEINRGSAVADLDNDGDLDIITVTADAFEFSENPHSFIYRNDISNANNWLKVKLNGVASNKDAFGAKVLAHAGSLVQLREIGGGESHASQNSSIAHFGLSDYSNNLDSVEVYWPGGKRQVIYDVPGNQQLEIIESDTATNINQISTNEINVYPNLLSTKDVLNITGESIRRVKIFDTQGAIIFVQNYKYADDIPIDLNALPAQHTSGFYYIMISIENAPSPIMKKIFIK